MYAFIYAAEKKKKDFIRVVSLGTGQPKRSQINPEKVNAFTWLNNLEDLIIDVEVTAHDYFTKFLSHSYHRFQIITEKQIDAADGTNIEELI